MHKQQRHWDIRAAANFVCGGSGGGLLVCAAAASFGAADLSALILAGMVLIGAGLTSVWFEIGRPWRALNVFRNFGSSWMSREAALAPLVFIVGMAALFSGNVFFVVSTGVLGAAFLYSQARMLCADKGIPAWRHPRCLPLVAASGLAEGAGLLAGAAPLLGENVFLGSAAGLVVMLALRAVLWRSYLVGLAKDSAPEQTLAALSRIHARFIVLGHALPVVLITVALWSPAAAPTCLIAAGVLATGGGWLLKYVLVTRAAFTQGFALKYLPARGYGMAGQSARLGRGPKGDEVGQRRETVSV